MTIFAAAVVVLLTMPDRDFGMFLIPFARYAEGFTIFPAFLIAAQAGSRISATYLVVVPITASTVLWPTRTKDESGFSFSGCFVASHA